MNDHSVDTPPPSLLTSSVPLPTSILSSFPDSPSSSPVDNADADREQCTARRPEGWGHSWPWCRGAWWWRRGSGPMARGWNERRNEPRGFGHLWARSGSSRTVRSLFSHPLFPSPKRPPGLLHVWAWRPPWPHGPWSPSPGLPSSPPTAPQHSQCKLDLRQNLPPFLLAMIISTWPKRCVLISDPSFPPFFVSASQFLIFLFEGVESPHLNASFPRTAPFLIWMF